MTSVAWLLPALPFLAAVVGLLAGRRLPAAAVALVGTGAALVLAVPLLVAGLRHPAVEHETVTLLTPTGSVPITVGTRVDGLAVVMTLMVCIVAFAVQVYSTAYLHGDARYPVYAAEVSLFTAAMLLVVLSADLMVLLVGWEVMGVCSYLLIGHYRELPSASAAAVKAFLVTRVGDVGFLFGIFTLGVGAGSFRIEAVIGAAQRGELAHGTVVAGTLLLLAGVAGKSAQFPLHTWLPDAMAGPTPISALIHAATMVAAGVFVVARLYPVFVLSPVTLDVLGAVACVTMLLGALVALVQDDLKRVLAWSTVSQLAYMLGGLAVGGYTAGLFHLLTHAAFKALLFLGAGAVLHATRSNLMSQMGGLGRRMPLTFATTLIGAAALAGLPPFSGAISKDAVLGSAYDAAFGGGNPAVPVSTGVATAVYLVGILTAVLTAAYVTRMVVLVFLGRYRGAEPEPVLLDPPRAMGWPLVALAGLAATLGLLSVAGGIDAALPAPVPGTGGLHVEAFGLVLTGLLVIGAIGGVALAWNQAPERDPAVLLGRAAVPLRAAFWVDTAYDVALVRPVPRLARAVLSADVRIVDGAVVGSGLLARAAGGGLRVSQRGNVQAYATGMLLAVVVIAASVAVFA